MSNCNKTSALVRLAAGLSHELNNIFMVIDGNLSLVCEQDEVPNPVREMIMESLVAVRRGIDLSKNLQAFAGRQPLHPVKVDLRAVVRAAMQAMKHEFAGIEIDLTLPDSPCYVKIDSHHVEAALVELARNAYAAMTRDGVIAIEMMQGEQLPGEIDCANLAQAVRLTVTGDGPGLPPDVLGCATEPMFTRRTGSGARIGWGLSIVDGFIRQSGGTMLLSAADKGGVRVDIYLPVLSHSD